MAARSWLLYYLCICGWICGSYDRVGLYCDYSRNSKMKCKYNNEIMKFTTSVLSLFLICACVNGQEVDTKWYSETSSSGITIQNSYPKGGRYTGPTEKHFNYSYLVFFSRVVNETGNPAELSVNFSADSIPIPNSPDTFVKLFLPSDTMTLEKQSLFSYGITELASLEKSTRFQKKINPNEDCLFYVVAVFCQTKPGAFSQGRGGNRTELILKGQDLFYNMLPQVNSLPCGQITFNK